MPSESRITAPDVLAALTALAEAGVDAWVEGGWGVDAVIGEATRPHRDLDLAVRSEQMDAAIAALHELGYASSLDLRPVRLVLEAAGGRSIDLHPVAFDGSGSGRQQGNDGHVFDYPSDGFGFGSIGGESVACLTAEQLVRFHLGYEPQEHDRRDMALLRDRLGVTVPSRY